jgi:hypothetical protein
MYVMGYDDIEVVEVCVCSEFDPYALPTSIQTREYSTSNSTR